MVGHLLGHVTSRRNITKAHSLLACATANATTPLSLPYSANTSQKEVSRCVDEASLHILNHHPDLTDRSHAPLKSYTGDFLN
jgi:hypothetical protein